jgi:LDH2 family malate/lactate/ureidoglycolate dehydrogenase
MDGKTDGVLLVAVRVEDFCPLADFRATVARLIAHVKSSPPAPGSSEVLVPGELESKTRRTRLREGIPIQEATWALLEESAIRADVAVP